MTELSETWCGEKIDDMTRDQLIFALKVSTSNLNKLAAMVREYAKATGIDHPQEPYTAEPAKE